MLDHIAFAGDALFVIERILPHFALTRPLQLLIPTIARAARACQMAVNDRTDPNQRLNARNQLFMRLLAVSPHVHAVIVSVAVGIGASVREHVQSLLYCRRMIEYIVAQPRRRAG